MLVNISVSWMNSPSSNACLFMLRWSGLPIVLAIVTVELMLILRVHALYNQNKRILVLLIMLFIGNILGFLVGAIYLVKHMSEAPSSVGQIFVGCQRTLPPLFYAEWIPLLVFESLIVILTMYKALAYRRYIPALRVLARDSMIYFSVVFLFLMNNVLFARFTRESLRGMWVQPATLASCLAVARMTLNIREFSSGDGGTDYILSTEICRTDRDTTISQLEMDVGGGESLHYASELERVGKYLGHAPEV